MKTKLPYFVAAAWLVGCISCSKDNYKAPSSLLHGRIQYKGEKIQVEYDRVSYEIFQFGFGKKGAISQTFSPDGSFSHLLFDGQYKLTIPHGQGPFKWRQTEDGKPDTVVIDLSGSRTIDLDVTPYYMIREAQLTAASDKVTGTCRAEKIITDRDAKNIETVELYINKTSFVSPANNIANVSVKGSDIANQNVIALTVAIPSVTPTQNYVFARIGIKIVDVEDRIFSSVQKLTF